MNPRNSILAFAAVSTLTLAVAGPAFSAESIVGTWDNEDCTRPMVIGQLSMQANDTICRFDNVKRKGNRVTWEGDCNGEQRTVVADLQKNGELNVSIIDSDVFFGLKRCDNRGGGGTQANGIPGFVKKNAPYASVRKKLLNAGWFAQGEELRGDGDCDASIDERCDTFPEALSCSGTGLGFCNMVWSKEERTITITTAGEEPSDMTITRVKKGTP